ncbi:MAG: HTH domain-containing protein [Myxococcota bacterium]|nr:HTH domain-containing protein [Myxococcota bacterium]
MTFTEAALVVLEREGRPMHSREIAQKAVDWGILSHVGKTPVQTMSARLSAAVTKGTASGPFVRIRPGVFALSTWKDPASGNSPAPLKNDPPSTAVAAPAPSGERNSAVDGVAAELTQIKKKKRRRRKKRADDQDGDSDANATSLSLNPPGNPYQDQTAPSGTGRDLLERLGAIMKSATRPMSIAALAQKIGFTDEKSIAILDALLISDGLDREGNGLRPRFIAHRSGYALAAREIGAEILALEGQMAQARERMVSIAERQVLRKLRSLSTRAFVKIGVAYLQRSGFDMVGPVHRDSSQGVHLCMRDRRYGGRFKTAVILRRDPADSPVSHRDVMDLRGALHHYDASSGMIITTSSVDAKAREEARVPNLPPVALMDGDMLSGELIAFGIGVKTRTVELPSFDEAFFSKLEA